MHVSKLKKDFSSTIHRTSIKYLFSYDVRGEAGKSYPLNGVYNNLNI